MSVLFLMITLFLIILCSVLLCLFLLKPSKCDCFYNEHYFDFEKIPIYIIHQSEKIERKKRFLQLIDKYFPKNSIFIIEPLSRDEVMKEIEKDVQDEKISNEGKIATLSNTPAKKGSLTFSALSLALTYLKIFEMEKTKRSSHFLILEDDFLPQDSFSRDFSKSIQKLEKRVGDDWDMLYLSCHFDSYLQRNGKQPAFEYFLKVENKMMHGLGGVIYKRKCVDIILKNIFPLNRQIDHDIPEKFILKNRINAHVLLNHKNKPLIYNDNFFYKSTTQNKLPNT